MKLSQARIGYAGYSQDFSAPGDRRRFVAYARMRGLPIEFAQLNAEYDAAYVTYSADLPGWIARKRRQGDRLKLVFELIDSYLAETGMLRRFLKGVGRYALGTDSSLSADFRRTLAVACETADAVICSTQEQAEIIGRYNKNVHLSFDHFVDEIGPPKANYDRSGKLRIVWEGQSTTLPNLQVIREPLNDLRQKVELHIITDPLIHRYFGHLASYPAMDALKGIECDKHFHRWSRGGFSRNITGCDVAVIPIERANALWWGKPENKLVMFWQLGMPVLTAATPAYRRAMESAGVDMACASGGDWGMQLEQFIGSSAAHRAEIGQHCRDYASRTYSTDEFMSSFDKMFASIGLGA